MTNSFVLMNFPKRAKRKIVSKLLFYRNCLKSFFSEVSVIPENILYCANFPLGTVIDCGCSVDAELAVYMTRRYASSSYCIDPTQKHSASLQQLASSSEKIHYLQAAIASESGWLSFHEPKNNESGSIMSDHFNTQNDHGMNYDVKSFNLPDLLSEIGLSNADYLKLDIEGAEYELISNTPSVVFRKFNQIFVEFHHHCLPSFSTEDTLRMVRKICSAGFKVITIDHHNYLFIRRDEPMS